MWLLLGACFVLVTFTSGQDALPMVNISQGTVVGSVVGDGSYFEFHGIPYADSTSGSHRFKAPRPPPSFEQTFEANRKDIKCVRALGVSFEGTEDCLVANVFTPTLDNTRQLPVMVWVKGKEFDDVDEQEYSFRSFIEKEVVVVSLNYRESVLGFLCLGTETAPGNAGLKDIIAGLKWVQENIAEFGGNPNEITLFGHGSGAAAVDLVTLSPMAEGLVQKAIAQSGNAFAPWAVTRDNLKYAIQVAEGLGHVITSIEELSNIFTRTSVSALMAIINELDLTDNALAFSPCIERQDLEDVEPFLVKTPTQAIADREFLNIPIIIGFVDNEGTIKAEEAMEGDWLERMNTAFADFIQPDLKFDTEDEQTEVVQNIRDLYFGSEPIDDSAIDDFIEYSGDTMMLVSSIREAIARSLASSAPTYLYQFSYRGSLGRPVIEPLVVESAVHSDELEYMFYQEAPNQAISARDLRIKEILVERWTNFAKTGEPNNDLDTPVWQPIRNPTISFLRILDDSETNSNEDALLEVLLTNPHPNRVAFWNQIYEEHFLDARTRWELDERDEDEDQVIPDDPTTTTTSTTTTTTTTTTTPPPDNVVVTTLPPTEDGGNEEDNDEENSASTAVGYTFLIITLFSILDKYHSSRIMS